MLSLHYSGKLTMGLLPTYLPTYLLPTTMGRLLPTGKNPAKPQQVAAELPLLTHSLVLTVRGLQADSE